MTSRRRKNQAQLSAPTFSQWIDSAILWIALGTLFTVPVIFSFFGFVAIYNEPKLVTLHIGAGLIAVLWLWQSALSSTKAGPTRANNKSLDLLRWAGKDPARWLIVAAAAWLIAQIISTLFSPLPLISLLGSEDPRSGYNLYDNISMFVIFITIATRFRSERKLKLLIITLISSGTIAAAYGIAQHFGWDPIGENAGKTRVWSSFGNPLNFGAYMVMTIPATLALTIPNRGRKYLWLGVLAVALGLQLAGLWYTGGRGAYVSFVIALLSFGVISLAIGHIRSLAPTAVALVAGVVVAVIIIAAPSPQEDIGIGRVLSIGSQIAGVNDAGIETSGGLDARFDIWNTTFKTATSWDTPQDESTIKAALRPVFGLGPDMYVYSYSIAGEPRQDITLVDHAHNYELQVLVEQGIVGLLLFLSVLGLLLAVSYKLIVRIRSRASRITFESVLVLAIVPAVLGKLTEMQTGVSRVSELAMTFALFGAVAALWAVSSRPQASAEPATSAATTTSRSRFAFTLAPNVASAATVIGAVAVTAVLLTALIGWDLRRTTASRGWAAAVTAPTDVERATGWLDSQELSPERPSFTNSLFIELFNAAIFQHDAGNDNKALPLMHAARNLLLDFEKHDPYKRDNQINLFKTEIVLSQWGQTEYVQQAVDRSRTIFELYPAYPWLLGIIAADMTLIGQDDLAAEYAQSISIAK